MYDNVSDARRYLDYTIIRYKRSPVLVKGITSQKKSLVLHILNISTDKMSTVDINDPSLNFEPVPLGYGTDEKGHVFFCSRLPRRKWKQGLHEESLTVHPGLLGKVGFGSMAGLRALANTIKGKHKSFKEAVETGGIFHRLFRIPSPDDKLIEYKGTVIGRVKDGFIELLADYKYLENYVKEVAK